METVSQFLTSCGVRLAPFERVRVARAGCWTSAVVCAAAGFALALGYGPRAVGTGGAGGAMAVLRVIIACGLGSVILLFVAYALGESIVERSMQARIRSYLGESRIDLETLIAAAETRKDQIVGGRRILALLKETATRR